MFQVTRKQNDTFMIDKIKFGDYEEENLIWEPCTNSFWSIYIKEIKMDNKTLQMDQLTSLVEYGPLFITYDLFSEYYLKLTQAGLNETCKIISERNAKFIYCPCKSYDEIMVNFDFEIKLSVNKIKIRKEEQFWFGFN